MAVSNNVSRNIPTPIIYKVENDLFCHCALFHFDILMWENPTNPMVVMMYESNIQFYSDIKVVAENIFAVI